MWGQPQKPPILSPCLGICEVGMDGLCVGCLRTLDEIACWGALDDAGRHEILRAVEDRRADHLRKR